MFGGFILFCGDFAYVGFIAATASARKPLALTGERRSATRACRGWDASDHVTCPPKAPACGACRAICAVRSTPTGRQRNVRVGSRLCENSDVGLARRKSVSISLIRKLVLLAPSVARRQLRKQFCAAFAQARFHTAWVKNGVAAGELRCPFLPLLADENEPASASGACGSGPSDAGV